jgi:nucleoside-diphosphate-sugar epimerase
MSPSTVLVTGAGRFVGGQLAARLAADPTIDRVVAVDTVAPRPELSRRLGRAEFVPVDLRSPLIAKVISDAKVDTVVHASMSAYPRASGGLTNGRRAMKELNVIGTMQLLAACQRSTTVARLVVKSTAAVYGLSSHHHAVFTEHDEPHGIPPSGYAKDAVEVEGYVRGFTRRRADVDVTVLRFTNVIGPRIDTVLSRYFSLRMVPTVLGYDGRLQLLHEEDALAVLERADPCAAAGCVQCRWRWSAAGIPSDPAGGCDRCSGTWAGRGHRRAAAARCSARRLFARTDQVAQLRPSGRHHPVARGVRLHPPVDDCPGLRRLCARPGVAPHYRFGMGRLGTALPAGARGPVAVAGGGEHAAGTSDPVARSGT